MIERSGVPTLAFDVGAAYAACARRRLRQLSGDDFDVDEAWVERQIRLPLEAGDAWPGTTFPISVGDGAIHADIIHEDADTFTTLLGTMPDAGPEAIATEAQVWRLPVTPYRNTVVPAFDPGPQYLEIQRRRDLAAVTVIDMTALWAGPLATSLLGRFGADVIKIEPSVRPDAFGTLPHLYQALNSGKTVLDLDLRDQTGRAEFEDLVKGADLLVQSFSRRVMPNLGYGVPELQQLNPSIATLSIAAFPVHLAERDWISYGSGIHAISGLGMLSGAPRPANTAYPDALTGIRAFGVALGLLGADCPSAHAEVTLLGSVAPIAPGGQR